MFRQLLHNATRGMDALRLLLSPEHGTVSASTLYLSIACFVTLLPGGRYTEDTDVLAQWKEDVIAAQSVPIYVEYEITVDNNEDLDSIRTFAWDYVKVTNARKDGKYYTHFEGYEQKDQDAPPHEKLYIFNGNITLLVETIPGLSEKGSDSVVNVRDGGDSSAADFEYYFIHIGFRNEFGTLERYQRLRGFGEGEWWLPESATDLALDGQEEIGGNRCNVYESQNGLDKLWIDSSEAVLRRRKLSWPSGAPKLDVSYSDYRKVNGYRFPFEIRWTLYGSEVLEPEFAGETVYTMHGEVRALNVGQEVKDTLFERVNIPPKTWVYDKRTDERYIYEGDRLSRTLESAFVNYERRITWVWVVLGGLAALFLVGGLVGYVVIRKRGKHYGT